MDSSDHQLSKEHEDSSVYMNPENPGMSMSSSQHVATGHAPDVIHDVMDIKTFKDLETIHDALDVEQYQMPSIQQ